MRFRGSGVSILDPVNGSDAAPANLRTASPNLLTEGECQEAPEDKHLKPGVVYEKWLGTGVPSRWT